MKKLIDFYKGIDGHHFVPPYWQVWGTLIVILMVVILLKGMFMFFAWWDGVVWELNHIN